MPYVFDRVIHDADAHVELDGYHLFHATRAELLHRLGCDAEAVNAYDQALGLISNGPECELLQRLRRAAEA